ncbi:MAG: proton-conducting transporter membrane subunit [Desulfovibrionaceae bacterium]|nr:proton-conducting transporter membrane subunit [Desulfovibrionaceae bacterium]
MPQTLAFMLIVLPFLAGAACFFLRARALRQVIVLGTGLALAASALILAAKTPFAVSPGSVLGVAPGLVVRLGDFALLGLIFYYGRRDKSRTVMFLAAAQAAMLAVFEVFILEHQAHPTLACDRLSLVLVLIVCLVGPLICAYALPYMRGRGRPAGAGQPGFFMAMIAFLGAMNGLALSNDLIWFYFFFEITTLCSYLLIRHDKTDIARENALRALWINSLAGLLLLAGVVWIYLAKASLDIRALVSAGSFSGPALFALVLVCAAGLAKAAQLPFQGWLLGAMVAPTPVSALLHSSTMVKAGVFLALRFAPAFAGTALGRGLALAGGLSFLAAAALAVGQSNGKKVLAYSTVSNLGLMIACAGLGSPWALAAGALLMIFHALGKGLLFLCLGCVEQRIGSRDIEDMRGLFAGMPLTAGITAAAALTMILPPFGMLLCKWMALESAAGSLALVVLLALGSALTVLYWTRWAGGLLAGAYSGPAAAEDQPRLMRWPLALLLAGAFAACVFAPGLLRGLALPAGAVLAPDPMAAFRLYPALLAAAAGLAAALWALSGARTIKRPGPYMSGLSMPGPGAYLGPMDRPVAVAAGNYYLDRLFGERRLTPWVNAAAGLILLFTAGGALS